MRGGAAGMKATKRKKIAVVGNVLKRPVTLQFGLLQFKERRYASVFRIADCGTYLYLRCA